MTNKVLQALVEIEGDRDRAPIQKGQIFKAISAEQEKFLFDQKAVREAPKDAPEGQILPIEEVE